MAVDQASAFEQTLARIRERYGLYFYLPEGVQPGEEHSVEVLLTDAARRRYPGAEVRYRRAYLAPNGANDARPIRLIHLPLPKRGAGPASAADYEDLLRDRHSAHDRRAGSASPCTRTNTGGLDAVELRSNSGADAIPGCG